MHRIDFLSLIRAKGSETLLRNVGVDMTVRTDLFEMLSSNSPGILMMRIVSIGGPRADIGELAQQLRILKHKVSESFTRDSFPPNGPLICCSAQKCEYKKIA